MNSTPDAVHVPMNYCFTFNFEQAFEYDAAQAWFLTHWHHCFSFSLVYLTLIFGLKMLMDARPRFELRLPLCTWSCLLAAFSIAGTLRVMPELVWGLWEHGFTFSMCDSSYVTLNKVSGFWSWLFTLSKLPELGDTLFIVLRKQPLIFLHWYHHVTTLSYVWYSFAEHPSTGRWFMVMNYTVHAVMYTYYALKAMKLRIPRQVNILITLGQLTQMVVGCYINVVAYQRKASGDACDVTVQNIKISLAIYFSFFVLFVHFFYNAYVHKQSKQSQADMKCLEINTSAPLQKKF